MIKQRYHFMKAMILMVILSLLLSQTYLIVPAATTTNVKKVTLDTKTITLQKGQSQTLKASVLPANATNKKIRWSSSDNDVATVTSGGKVLAKEEGRAIITARATNGKKAMCKVTVEANDEVTKVLLNKQDLTLDIDDNYQLEAAITPETASEAELTWYSDDEDVASVDDEGNVFPMGEGTTIITAEADNGVFDSCTITVTEKISVENEINLYTDTVSLKVGDNAKLDATITPDTGNDGYISWDSNDADIVTVDSNGYVKAIAEGSAMITATLPNGNYDVCQINVSAGVITATKILLNRESSILNVGDQLTLTATIEPANSTDKEIKWSSSNTSIATVDNSGIVTAKAQGSVVITATSNGLSASCTVTVSIKTVAVTSVTLSQSNITLNVNDTTALSANVLPTDATDKTILWESSNAGIASVDNSGNIRGISKGTATITISTSNGKTASCTVTVNDTPTRVIMIDSTYTITLQGTNECLDVTDAGNANGTNVQIFQSNSTNAQMWRFENHTDGTVSLIPQCAQDKVLDVMRTNNSTSGALQAGCNVDIYNHNDFPAQHFYLEQFSDGSYVIRLDTNPNLVVQAASALSSANVSVENYDQSNSLQRWNIVLASATAEPTEQKRLAYVCNTDGEGVFVRDQGSTSGSKVGGFTEGQEITVIGDIVNGWYKVEGTDRFTGAAISGYSYSEYITFTKAANTDTNVSFNIRTTAPDLNDYHYYSTQNIFVASDFGMPNCTAYAWGRIWEIYGTKLPSGYFNKNAYLWWDDNIKSGKYKYGSEPRVGAIAVWDASSPGSEGCGHVAVVEKIENGIVYVSQSFYNGSVFKYAKIGSTGYLRGYIYVDQPNY